MGVNGQRYATAALPLDRPGTHCTGGWMGLGADLDGCGKSRHHRRLNTKPSSRYRIAVATTLSRLTSRVHTTSKSRVWVDVVSFSETSLTTSTLQRNTTQKSNTTLHRCENVKYSHNFASSLKCV